MSSLALGSAGAIVAGHLCVDLRLDVQRSPPIVPGRIASVGPLTYHPGGCVANTGSALAALGTTVRLVGLVGSDPLGEFILEWANHLDTLDASGITVERGAATSYSVIIQPPGRDRAIWHYTGVNDLFDGSAVRFEGARLFHLGYPPFLSALVDNDGEFLVDLMAAAKSAGLTTSLDMATPDMDGPASAIDWVKVLGRVLPFVDVAVPSLDDMRVAMRRQLEDISEIRTLANDLLEAGTAIVMLTAGVDGAYLATASANRLQLGGVAIEPIADTWCDRELWGRRVDAPVVDTTGAGDSAAAGLLHGILTGRRPEEALCLANATAATRIAGLRIPDAVTVENWAETRQAFTCPPSANWTEIGP